MNTALKQWKEAATIILAAGRTHLGLHVGVKKTPEQGSCPPPGRSNPNASLPPASCFDYDVLLLKRSSTSGFMPNAYVFPGGLLEPSDFSSEWMDIFKAFRNLPNLGLGRVKQPAGTRPPIFATDRVKLGSPVPGVVALRICALRETFEESGVLLVLNKTQENTLMESITHEMPESRPQQQLAQVQEVCSNSELDRWRSLVNRDPSNFLTMCRQLQVVPNIWALHEWGNWLTPPGLPGERKRRYDTAFFICCLEQTPPHTLQDEREIVHFKWSTPPEVLQSYQARDLWIAPPQFYDLRRMCHLPSLSDLHGFASRRATEGCEHWLPVRVVTDGSYTTLLPGDKLYPVDGSGQMGVNDHQEEETGPKQSAQGTPFHLGDKLYPVDGSGQVGVNDSLVDHQEEENSALHRMVFADLYSPTLQVTIKPKYKHLLPFQTPALPGQGPNSQL